MRVGSLLAGALAGIGLNLSLAGGAQATTVLIDGGGASGWGCTTCSGGLSNNVNVGNTVTLVNYNKSGPLQLTLGPGTYNITNASTSVGNYSAFRFDGGSADWAWNYVIASDNGNGTANIIKAAGLGGVLPSQTAWQNATGLTSYYYDNGLQTVATNIAAVDYLDTFTLSTATVVDFFVIDYYLPDNAGGIALNITKVAATPIPAALPLFATALAAFGFAARRRRAPAA
ncbi:MAG TPA: hypothetical protein VMT54_07920 [Candidatus Cybelea sp.]|nr:hypothetical protein [Candidatus Cybelea sp.]